MAGESRCHNCLAILRFESNVIGLFLNFISPEAVSCFPIPTNQLSTGSCRAKRNEEEVASKFWLAIDRTLTASSLYSHKDILSL